MKRSKCAPRALSRRRTRLLTALLVLAILSGWARPSEAQVAALGGRVAADVTTTSTTFVNVTGLTWYVAASTSYTFACRLAYTTTGGSADANELDLSVNGPASPSAVRYTVTYAQTATTVNAWSANAYDTDGPNTGSTPGTVLPAVIRGTIENGLTAGAVFIRMRRFWDGNNSEGTSATVSRGSFCTVYRQ